MNARITIFLSYSSKDEQYADMVDDYFAQLGLQLKRDIRDVEYCKSFKDFMHQIGKTDFVIMLISDNYLKSRYCMYEVMELLNTHELEKRILPLVLPGTDIFNTQSCNKYYDYWNDQITNASIDFEKYDSEQHYRLKKQAEAIRRSIDPFFEKITDLKIIRIDSLKSSEYEPILKRLEDFKAQSKTQSSKLELYDKNPEFLEDNIWYKACKINTIEIYEKYIHEYPEGRYVHLAIRSIEELNEKNDWLLISQSNNLNDFEEYIIKHPSSKFNDDAKIFIKDIKAWNEAKELNSFSAFDAYLIKFQNGKFAEEAKSIIKKRFLVSKIHKYFLLRKIPITIVFIALLLLVLGISQINNFLKNSKYITDKTVNSKEELVIGSILPLTGNLMDFGKKAKAGIDKALNSINSIPSVPFNLKISYYDSQSSPEGAIKALLYLTKEEKLKIILGPITSSEVFACSPIVNQNKVILLTASATHPEITKKGGYVFRTIPNDTQEATFVARFIKSNFSLNQGIIVFAQNNEYGNSLNKAFVSEIGQKEQNIKSFFVSDYEQNFHSIFYKTNVAKNPIYILISSNPDLTGMILQSLNEVVKAPIVILVGADFSINQKLIPERLLSNVYFSLPYGHKKETSFETEFFSLNLDTFEAGYFETLYLISIAIKKCGYSTKEIKDYFNSINKNNPYQGFTKSFYFDSTGSAVCNYDMYRYNNLALERIEKTSFHN